MAQTLQPDVLLLDMELPGLKGTEIAQRLRQQRSPVRILGISAHDDEGYIFGLLMQGAAGYMTKDDALTAIGEAVRGVARGEVGWFSRRVMAKVMQRNFGEAAVTPPDQTVVLSLRERQVLQLVAQGEANEQIAQILKIADGTVKNHVTNIYSKLGVRTRAEAVAWAWKQGIMDDK